MDISIVADALKASPFALVLLYILYTVWKYVQKKDQELTETSKATNDKLLEMQEKNIQSNNLVASSNIQLTGALNNLSQVIAGNQSALMHELGEIKKKNNQPKLAQARPSSLGSAAA